MSSTRREIRQFHVVVVHDGKGMYQKRDPRAKLLFCKSKPIGFFAVLVAVAVAVAVVVA